MCNVKFRLIERLLETRIYDNFFQILLKVRLVHVNSEQALRYSGKVYPDWGFYQNEVVCDKNIVQLDTVWNVEEHRYTKSNLK